MRGLQRWRSQQQQQRQREQLGPPALKLERAGWRLNRAPVVCANATRHNLPARALTYSSLLARRPGWLRPVGTSQTSNVVWSAIVSLRRRLINRIAAAAAAATLKPRPLELERLGPHCAGRVCGASVALRHTRRGCFVAYLARARVCERSHGNGPKVGRSHSKLSGFAIKLVEAAAATIDSV